MTAAPVEAPKAPNSATTGLGLLSGVGAFGFVGLVEGVLTWVRSPRGSVPPHLFPALLLQCVGVLLALGIPWGIFLEALLLSARSVPLLARFGRWWTGGPRRWVAPDPNLSTGLLLSLTGLALVPGLTLPLAWQVISNFHNQTLMALAISLGVIAVMGVWGLFVLLLAAPVRAVIARVGRLGNPVFVVAFFMVGLGVHNVRFLALNPALLRNLDLGAAVMGLTLTVGTAVSLLLLGMRVRRTGVGPTRRALITASVVPLLVFFVWVPTYGRWQTVARAVDSRSVLSRHIVWGLQKLSDFDHDGFGRWFGGGDCNDRDPDIHPGAADIADNGVDENCSGADASTVGEESNGGLVAMNPERARQRPSILLLSVDAMRPDHLGAYGYRRNTSPNLDAFARRSARFLNAFTASPRSLRSFAGIFTGRYPSLVAWGHEIQFPPLEESNITLAEQLRMAGYHTAAFAGAGYFIHTAGFFQGFDEVHQGDAFKNDGANTVQELLGYLRAHAPTGRPFFAWVHLFEPHDPYRDWAVPREFGHAPMDMYDEEIAHADELLGPVYTLAEELADTRPLITFVYADHGEAFGEHGVEHHSFDLHDEALRVPLIVRGPQIPAGPRDALTSLLDLEPTALNLAFRAPATPVTSQSLVGVLEHPVPGITPPGWRDHLYGEVTPDGYFPSEQKSIYAPPWKLIYDLRRGTWELFDIARDPGELINLYDDSPRVASQLRARLLGWMDTLAAAPTARGGGIESARLLAPPRPQNRMSVRFGDIVELLGYDLPQRKIPVGGIFRVVLYYRVLARTNEPYWMDLYFVDEAGNRWPHYHGRHQPIYGRYPTTMWRVGEFLRDEVYVRAVASAAPARLRARFAVAPDEGSHVLPTPTGPLSVSLTPDQAVDLGPVEVTPPGR